MTKYYSYICSSVTEIFTFSCTIMKKLIRLHKDDENSQFHCNNVPKKLTTSVGPQRVSYVTVSGIGLI